MPIFLFLFYRTGDIKNECDYVLDIPLPFSAFSLTYTKDYFYVIRSDGEIGSSTLYRIPAIDLIGGYLHWHKMVEDQCQLCTPEERPLYFDFDNQTETCSV